MVSGIRSLTSKCFSYNTLLSKTALSKSKSSYHLTAIRRQPYACPALLIAVLCTRCCMYALLSMGGWKLDLVLFPEQSWNIIPEKCPQRQQRTVETKSGTGDNGYTWGYRFFSSPIGLWPILQTCSTAESMFIFRSGLHCWVTSCCHIHVTLCKIPLQFIIPPQTFRLPEIICRRSISSFPFHSFHLCAGKWQHTYAHRRQKYHGHSSGRYQLHTGDIQELIWYNNYDELE